jgi:DNA-binding Xre family transcriptional regulator
MNNLALMLSEALDQLQNSMKKGQSGHGKSKQPSLSQLNRMQQQLNQNMQKMRDQMQKQGNMSQSQKNGMSEQLAKMAREQQMIRESLEKINGDENKDGTGRLGNLDKISKEMEQTVNDIVNRRVTDDLLKRQQQIQSRLLEAEKAEKQQEQDQQRESNAGKDLPPGYIKALQDYQKLNEKQTEQVKTVSPALNLYYKLKIKSYFDQLNAH